LTDLQECEGPLHENRTHTPFNPLFYKACRGAKNSCNSTPATPIPDMQEEECFPFRGNTSCIGGGRPNGAERKINSGPLHSGPGSDGAHTAQKPCFPRFSAIARGLQGGNRATAPADARSAIRDVPQIGDENRSASAKKISDHRFSSHHRMLPPSNAS
jgi:hypothetical protein